MWCRLSLTHFGVSWLSIHVFPFSRLLMLLSPLLFWCIWWCGLAVAPALDYLGGRCLLRFFNLGGGMCQPVLNVYRAAGFMLCVTNLTLSLPGLVPLPMPERLTERSRLQRWRETRN